MISIGNYILISFPITIPIGILLWISAFLNTYKHFPKMGKKERWILSISNATGITIGILGIVYIALIFVARNFLS